MQNNAKLYIGALLIAVAATLGWIFVLPVYNEYLEIKTALADRESILDQRKATIDKIKALEAEYQTRSADMNRLASVVPTKKSAAELVSSFEDIASRNGLQLLGVSISEQKTTNTNSPYNMVGIDFTLAGSYLSFLGFLDGIERSIRLIDVQSIDASQAAETNTINFKVKANSYYLK